MSTGTEWNRNGFSGSTTSQSTANASSRKIPLAEFRYGKEEMICLYPDPPSRPADIPNMSAIVREKPSQPLAFIPLTEEEQVALTGNVNSGSVYSSRGRGGYRGGGRGRGRGGRSDYHRSTSEEYSERGHYHRTTSDSGWNDEVRSGYSTRGGRALRDSNWRSDVNEIKKSDKKDHWNPLPEWASDEPQKKSVGIFDKNGQFSTSDQNDDGDNGAKNTNTNEADRDLCSTPEDVFESIHHDLDNITPPPSPPSTGDTGDTETEPDNTKTRITSIDSVEEMQRRFEMAAEAVLSTDDDSPLPKSNPPSVTTFANDPVTVMSSSSKPPVINDTNDALQWLYKDPHGDLQGPFSDQEMFDWYTAGYFQMDLLVRRVCDTMLLPLGQVIRIWNRNPFTAGSYPPPIQKTEPFWQQLFKHQHQLFAPQTNDKPSVLGPPQTTPTVAMETVNKSDPSPIWGLANARKSPEDNDQWPDLSEKGLNHTHNVTMSSTNQVPTLDEVMKQKLKMDEEERQKLEEKKREERRKEEERKRILEEERIRTLEIEEKKRLMAEESKRLMAERLQREEEERLRQEQLLAAAAAKQKEIEEERKAQQRKKEEENLLQLTINDDIHSLKKQQQQTANFHKMDAHVPLASVTNVNLGMPPGVWMYDQPDLNATSFLKIQQEEKKRERERLLEEERRQQYLLLQQQHNVDVTTPTNWSSLATPTTIKPPLSFLAIQQEQERLITDYKGNVAISKGKKNNAAPIQQSSWSTIAAANKPHPLIKPPPQTSTSKGPPPTVDHTHSLAKEQQKLSFWDECALESNSNNSTNNVKSKQDTKKPPSKGTVKKTEEDKVRQLFSYTSTDHPFTAWCANELQKFNTDVDAATFVSLLLEVDSTYEVHDYIKSFLGETDAVHSFAKQFLERRQKLKQKHDATSGLHKKTNSNKSHPISSDTAPTNPTSAVLTRNSKKKKKNKMQKMPPSAVLGFTVNAAERPNAGEIHSIKDAL